MLLSTGQKHFTRPITLMRETDYSFNVLPVFYHTPMISRTSRDFVNCCTFLISMPVCFSYTGVRLYFTVNPFGTQKGRPQMLTLVHVRLPPGFLKSAAPQRPNNIHMAYYKQGKCSCCTY